MKPDDDVCLCFHVSQRKLVSFIQRTNPSVASQLSECLGAGTGCGWCRPYLAKLHAQHKAGDDIALDEITAEDYAANREDYRAEKRAERQAQRDKEE